MGKAVSAFPENHSFPIIDRGFAGCQWRLGPDHHLSPSQKPLADDQRWVFSFSRSARRRFGFLRDHHFGIARITDLLVK
ncbi:MAG: hypothetical protein M0017_04540 [Desulfobacteraceae bacterium]|nr:hypothetical protein [Desulfobacteraceae bacterium]